jgi:hypothetical protein
MNFFILLHNSFHVGGPDHDKKSVDAFSVVKRDELLRSKRHLDWIWWRRKFVQGFANSIASLLHLFNGSSGGIE